MANTPDFDPLAAARRALKEAHATCPCTTNAFGCSCLVCKCKARTWAATNAATPPPPDERAECGWPGHAAIDTAVREPLETARARAQQSACVCALLADAKCAEWIGRSGRGEKFGIEARNHLSDCPAAIEADIRSLIRDLGLEEPSK